MTNEELLALLTRARKVLESYLFTEGDEQMRDDVAQVCAAIDDVIPEPEAAPAEKSARAKVAKHPGWNLIPQV